MVWAGEDQVAIQEPQPCIESGCAWWSVDRCAVVGIGGEVLTSEPIERTSVSISVFGANVPEIKKALAAALGGNDGE